MAPPRHAQSPTHTGASGPRLSFSVAHMEHFELIAFGCAALVTATHFHLGVAQDRASGGNPLTSRPQQ